MVVDPWLKETLEARSAVSAPYLSVITSEIAELEPSGPSNVALA